MTGGLSQKSETAGTLRGKWLGKARRSASASVRRETFQVPWNFQSDRGMDGIFGCGSTVTSYSRLVAVCNHLRTTCSRSKQSGKTIDDEEQSKRFHDTTQCQCERSLQETAAKKQLIVVRQRIITVLISPSNGPLDGVIVY
jgi:hypothetical protein